MKHWELPEDWEIEAALPEYVDGEGDATRLLLADGTERLVRARLRTVLERLARRHCRALPLLRAWAKERTALSQTAPLAIAAELVLVPFRARRGAGGNRALVRQAHPRALGRQDAHRAPSRSGHPAPRSREAGGSRRAAPPLLAESMASRHLGKEIKENERPRVERRSSMGCGALCCIGVRLWCGITFLHTYDRYTKRIVDKVCVLY